MQIVILTHEESSTLKYKLPSPEICNRASVVGVICRDREHVVILKHRNGEESKVQSMQLADFDLMSVPLTLDADYSIFDNKQALLRASTLSYVFLDALDSIMRERGLAHAMRP